jgi:hypothetical protein
VQRLLQALFVSSLSGASPIVHGHPTPVHLPLCTVQGLFFQDPYLTKLSTLRWPLPGLLILTNRPPPPTTCTGPPGTQDFLERIIGFYIVQQFILICLLE